MPATYRTARRPALWPTPGVSSFVRSDVDPEKHIPAPMAWLIPGPHGTRHQREALASETAVILVGEPISPGPG